MRAYHLYRIHTIAGMSRAVVVCIFILTSCLALVPVKVHPQGKDIVGWLEKARIYPGALSLRARIDTGAKSSSLNAPHIKFFKRDGKTWASLNVVNDKGKETHIEKVVVRTAEIKQKGVLSQKRPVIMLGICLGDLYKEVEVNLVDRSNYNYQLLIGRNYLEGSFLVDPSLTFTTRSKCSGMTEP